MAGCGEPVEVAVPTKFSHKMVKMACGNTGYYGDPVFCEKCEPMYADRDWRAEAEAAGERWDDDY